MIKMRAVRYIRVSTDSQVECNPLVKSKDDFKEQLT
jgi:hypothetical protein